MAIWVGCYDPDSMEKKKMDETDQTSAHVNPEYLARNLNAASAIGLNAALCKTLGRVKARKDCPLWLIESLYDCVDRSNVAISVAVDHRDEVPKHLSPNA